MTCEVEVVCPGGTRMFRESIDLQYVATILSDPWQLLDESTSPEMKRLALKKLATGIVGYDFFYLLEDRIKKIPKIGEERLADSMLELYLRKAVHWQLIEPINFALELATANDAKTYQPDWQVVKKVYRILGNQMHLDTLFRSRRTGKDHIYERRTLTEVYELLPKLRPTLVYYVRVIPILAEQMKWQDINEVAGCSWEQLKETLELALRLGDRDLLPEVHELRKPFGHKPPPPKTRAPEDQAVVLARLRHAERQSYLTAWCRIMGKK